MDNSDMPAMPQSGVYDSDDTPNDCSDRGGSGLTKREHFAAMAMKGIIASGNIETSIFKDSGELTRGVAKGALDYADALLAELEK